MAYDRIIVKPILSALKMSSGGTFGMESSEFPGVVYCKNKSSLVLLIPTAR